MTVRGKLLLAQLPLAMALAVVGIVAVSSVASLGRLSEALLHENYRSVLAAQRMRDALERMEDNTLLSLVTGAPTVADARPSIELFERELAAAEGNITEANELATLEELRRLWIDFQKRWQRSAELPPDDRARFVVDQLQPAAAGVREQTQRLLNLNQDAMVRKGQRARREAARIGTLMISAAVAALLLGAFMTTVVTRRLVQPLELLARTVSHLREGDFDTRVNISGSDEVAQLAGGINAMATRLSHYRSSSLGELLLAQEASQAAIDSLPDPVAVFDASGNVLNLNKAAETLLNLSLEAGGGAPLEQVDPAVRDCFDRLRLHVLSGKGAYVPRGFEEAVRVASSTGEYYFLPRATPVHSDEGAVTGATVVLQDVTRLRRVDDLRNNLVATVAHELRTPLTSLRMAIHLCLEQAGGPLSDKQADLLYAAREECERLQAIVDELLDLARIQSGHIELHCAPTPPAALIDTVLETHRNLAEEQHLLVEREDLPGLSHVLADRERIQLVLSNLFTNAVRHTPAGGRITMRAAADNGAVRFEVADTGTGIPEEYQNSIFDRFVRIPDTPGGTGLGLSIAKEIVEAHGGSIGVDSRPGEGATFWFTLPTAGGMI
jgi:signal transduction histidine kinase